MIHIDLFSGIGGFAYAVDQVWDNAEHIFCDNDKFCREVLKKHWPNSKIYEDIREITADTIGDRLYAEHNTTREAIQERELNSKEDSIRGCGIKFGTTDSVELLTGGFPCQPFSQAGKRRGTTDDRFLWPEMLRVIQLTKPQWVIAENVRGLINQADGLVFEQVCLDLEAAGYEVQPFIIPAVAVNAPHRRDRVWFVANKQCGGLQKPRPKQQTSGAGQSDENITNPKSGQSGKQTKQEGRKDFSGRDSNAPDAKSGWTRRTRREMGGERKFECNDWEQNWLEVATELCGMDDGLSEELDFAGWTKAGHRVQRLKSLGNSIVPQLAIQILKAINPA